MAFVWSYDLVRPSTEMHMPSVTFEIDTHSLDVNYKKEVAAILASHYRGYFIL